MRTDIYDFQGFEATVIVPDNPNGKWVWKTEFLYAFDKAEEELLKLGYTRVYYSISNKYGSYNSVRLMRSFYHHVKEKYCLVDKCILFGFSRGGLYAFNFALFYPEYVEKIYLDAPVLDMKTWPPRESEQILQLYEEYGLNEQTLKTFKGNPVDNLEEFFSHKIPLFVVAGGSDEVVPFERNAKVLLDYAKERSITVHSVIKPECKHHPHSLDDVQPIIDFVIK